jgi:hypothetical protein
LVGEIAVTGGLIMAPAHSNRRYVLTIADKSHRIGRLQLQVRRAFLAHEGRPLTTPQLMRRCYPRVRDFKVWHYWNVHRAALKFAVRLGRSKRGRGLPIIWAPKPGCI